MTCTHVAGLGGEVVEDLTAVAVESNEDPEDGRSLPRCLMLRMGNNGAERKAKSTMGFGVIFNDPPEVLERSLSNPGRRRLICSTYKNAGTDLGWRFAQ